MRASARKSRFITLFNVFSATAMLAFAAQQGAAQAPYRFDSATVSGLPARNIGSATMSGRIAALDAVEENGRITVFVGAASGGVWKSLNGGTTYKPVFDREDVQSIGAVAIDPSNSKTVWVGTGEAWTAQQRLGRRWRLQIHGRRRELDECRVERQRAYREDFGKSQRWKRRAGLRHWTSVG